jgi:hypothetical protein
MGEAIIYSSVIGAVIGSAIMFVFMLKKVMARDDKIAELRARLIKAGVGIKSDFDDTSDDYIGSQYGI